MKIVPIALNTGELLRARRAAAGMTQAELANLCHVTPQMISEMERGQTDGSLGIWLSIAAGLGIGLGELLQPKRRRRPRRRQPRSCASYERLLRAWLDEALEDGLSIDDARGLVVLVFSPHMETRRAS